MKPILLVFMPIICFYKPLIHTFENTQNVSYKFFVD